MVCPKCGAELDDNCDYCYSCNMQFKHSNEDEINANSENVEIISSDKNDDNKKNKKMSSAVNKVKDFKHKKIVLTIICCIVAVALLTILLFSILRGNPEKIAKIMKSKIGSDITEVAKAGDVDFNKQSSLRVINDMKEKQVITFDYIYESDKIIEVDGYNVPEYFIAVKTRNDGNISVAEEIYLRDYRYQKKDYRGVKIKKAVSIDQLVNKGSLDEIKDVLDIKPISILFNEDKTAVYTYRFCFENDDDNIETREFIVSVDSSEKVIDISQTDIQNFYNNIK